MKDMYHRNVTRLKLTRNIAATFDPVHDEIVGSLGDCIPTMDHGMSHILLEGVPIVHIKRRVGQGIYRTDHATYRRSNHESSICGCPSMWVIIRLSVGRHLVLTLNKGSDYDYQTLVMSFIENFTQSAFIIGFFPKILRPCAPVSCTSLFSN